MKRVDYGAGVFVNTPYVKIGEYLPIALRDRINPEIYLSAVDLDRVEFSELERIGRSLDDAGLSCTVHGPYLDLSASGGDPEITRVSRMRLEKALKAALILKARTMVAHAGFDRFRYGEILEAWLDNSAEFWTDLGRGVSGGLRIALENTFEDEPEQLCRLMDRLDPNLFGHCFDIGHFNIFGRCGLVEWLESIDERLIELHLHDNHGRTDEHLAIGAGEADFETLFRYLSGRRKALFYTIEAHDIGSVKRSLAELSSLLCRF